MIVSPLSPHGSVCLTESGSTNVVDEISVVAFYEGFADDFPTSVAHAIQMHVYCSLSWFISTMSE